jgi:hypothetical protein
VVAQECTKLLEQADDSSGLIGAVVSVSIGMIDEVMERWPEDLDSETADETLQLLKAHTLFHVRCDMTDAAVLLVEAVMNWSDRFDAGKKIYDFIETIVTSDAVKNKTYRYEEERLRMFQLMTMYQQHDEGALEALIETHREYPAISKDDVPADLGDLCLNFYLLPHLDHIEKLSGERDGNGPHVRHSQHPDGGHHVDHGGQCSPVHCLLDVLLMWAEIVLECCQFWIVVVSVQCHHPSAVVFTEPTNKVRVCAVKMEHLSGSQYSLHHYLITTFKASS